MFNVSAGFAFTLKELLDSDFNGLPDFSKPEFKADVEEPDSIFLELCVEIADDMLQYIS